MASRNMQFDTAHTPLPPNSPLRLTMKKVICPVPLLNPTEAHFASEFDAQAATDSPQDKLTRRSTLPPNVEYRFTTRNRRKGRHKLVVTGTSQAGLTLPSSSRRPSSVLYGIWRMFTFFPYWDVSWLVAVNFTLGSVVWIVNSFFVLLPLRWPFTQFQGEVLYGGGLTAFTGATIFEIGGVLLMFEALNATRASSFGWAVQQLYDERFGAGEAALQKVVPVDTVAQARNSTWVWWPSFAELQGHYLRDLGFLACTTLFVSATIFSVSGITALPWLFRNMSQAELDIWYWTPQVIGGIGFIVSGCMFTVETQKYWWKPAVGAIGWHVGFWNTIGGIGFFLCPCFGYSPEARAQYIAAMTTCWGSWAFLLGSIFQWYESLEKHPLEIRQET